MGNLVVQCSFSSNVYSEGENSRQEHRRNFERKIEKLQQKIQWWKDAKTVEVGMNNNTWYRIELFDICTNRTPPQNVCWVWFYLLLS